MSDLRLKRIVLRNWMKVKNAEISFPESGLILVIGSNLAAEGKMESVGSGKTALGEALSRALVGVDGRYSNLSDFAPDSDRRNTYVKVEADLMGKPLTVEMGYKCPELSRTSSGLRFQHGDKEPIQRSHPDRTREELSKMLQVTPELANWTVFLDGDKLKFNRMSQEDSVGLLMKALAQPPWTDYHGTVAKKLTAANRQVYATKMVLDTAKSRSSDAQLDLEDAEKDHDEAIKNYEQQKAQQEEKVRWMRDRIGADKGSIRAAEEKMASIKKQLKLLEEQHAQANHQSEMERQTLRDKFAEMDSEWLGLSGRVAALNAELNQHISSRNKMMRVPKSCPTCGKPWDQAHSAEELKKSQENIDAAQAEFEKAQAAFSNVDRRRSALNAKIREIERKMREGGQTRDVQHLGEQYDQNERLVKNLTGSIHQRELQIAEMEKEVDASIVNKKQAIVAERKRAFDESKKQVEKAAEDLASDEEVQKIVQYWYRAYSPTGIPNMVLSDAIPPLNRVAQRISSLMTGGTICVTYSTTSTLVSGETRPKLVTRVENRIGSTKLEGSSKGESGLTNLIIAENLNEVGQVSRRVGFRWYDEITSGQDSVVRRSIFSYLKDVAHRLGILIFVVDHHVEAASYADHVLVAEKTVKEGTLYKWRQ